MWPAKVNHQATAPFNRIGPVSILEDVMNRRKTLLSALLSATAVVPMMLASYTPSAWAAPPTQGTAVCTIKVQNGTPFVCTGDDAIVPVGHALYLQSNTDIGILLYKNHHFGSVATNPGFIPSPLPLFADVETMSWLNTTKKAPEIGFYVWKVTNPVPASELVVQVKWCTTSLAYVNCAMP